MLSYIRMRISLNNNNAIINTIHVFITVHIHAHRFISFNWFVLIHYFVKKKTWTQTKANNAKENNKKGKDIISTGSKNGKLAYSRMKVLYMLYQMESMRAQSNYVQRASSTGKCEWLSCNYFIVLHLIGWEGGTCFLDQSQSIHCSNAKPMQSRKTFNTQLKIIALHVDVVLYLIEQKELQMCNSRSKIGKSTWGPK